MGGTSRCRRSLGLARNILASRLKDLVSAGILEVVPAADGSAYHQYALTEKGRELFGLIVALRQWGEDHLFEAGEPHSVLLDTTHQRPLQRLQVIDADGRPLNSSDTFVRKVSAP